VPIPSSKGEKTNESGSAWAGCVLDRCYWGDWSINCPAFVRSRGNDRHTVSQTRGDTEEYLAYAASKGGLVSITRTIARAYGRENVKAFVVAPGFVRTPMVDEFFQTHGEQTIVNEIALPRLTEPDDVAPTVVFLASGLMDHATGCTVDINAGSHVR